MLVCEALRTGPLPRFVRKKSGLECNDDIVSNIRPVDSWMMRNEKKGGLNWNPPRSFENGIEVGKARNEEILYFRITVGSTQNNWDMKIVYISHTGANIHIQTAKRV